MMDKAKQIKAWRLSNGYTQDEAARIIGRTLRSWQRYESGEIDVPSWVIKLTKGENHV